MESRIYSVLFQFNHGIEQALAALDTLEKMGLEPPEYIQRIRVRFQEVAANANSHFTDKISKRERREQLEHEQERRKQELREEDPSHIYHRVEHAEYVRRELCLPPHAVILPWTKVDDDRAIARLKAFQATPSSHANTPHPPPSDAPPSTPTGGEGGQP